MMKLALAIILNCLFISHTISSDCTKHNIVGLWQINSSNVSSALHDNYKFYPNGTFDFGFDQYDDTKRIISIGGKYEFKLNQIVLTISYRKEIDGGEIVRGSPGFQKGWVLNGGKL